MSGRFLVVPVALGLLAAAPAWGYPAIAFAADGKTLAIGWGEVLRLVDVPSGKERLSIRANRGGIHAVAFTPDSKHAVSAGADNLIRFWDVDSGEEFRQLAGHRKAVTCFAFFPAGKRLVSGSLDGTIRVWDLAGKPELENEIVETTTAHEDGVSSLTMSADGRHLLSGGLVVTEPRWWRTGPLNAVRAFDLAYRATLSPDGSLAVMEMESARQFRVLHLISGKTVAKEKLVCQCLTFSPDSKLLAMIDANRRLRIWEVATCQEAHSVFVLMGNSLAFSPDGRRLAAGTMQGKVVFHDLNLAEVDEPGELSATDLDRLWQDLAGDSAAAGYKALWALAAAPSQAIPLVKERLKVAPMALRPKDLAKLIADLDDARFAVRNLASKQLHKLGWQVEPALLDALEKGKLSLEASRRLETALARLEPPVPLRGEPLREWRAVQLLEMIGTRDAQALLSHLAEASPPARLAAARLRAARQ